MPTYTARGDAGYGDFFEDYELKYVFADLPEAQFVAEFVTDALAKKQAVIDAQNERAKKNNERNSELEARIELLELRARDMIDAALSMIEGNEDDVRAYLLSCWLDADTQDTPDRMELPMPVHEITELADDDPAQGLD